MDRSPLHLAAERGHTGIVELLVDKLRANVSARTKDGSTLMHISSQFGHPDTAMAFLRKGVPMLMPNKVKDIVNIPIIKSINRILKGNKYRLMPF